MRTMLHVCALAAALCALTLGPITARAQEGPRERTSLNADWRFLKGDPDDARTSTTTGGSAAKLDYRIIKKWVIPTGIEFTSGSAAAKAARPEGNLGGEISYVQPNFNDAAWRPITLPHDWAAEGPFIPRDPGGTGKLPFYGIGWYRKHLAIPAADQGKNFFLDIDGAMSYSMVWLNGQFVGGWPYGYSSYRVDLTPYVKAGAENVLVIRLSNPPNSSRWYPGSGIYRNVWLVKTTPVHVAQWGTYVTTPEVSPAAATVSIKVKADNKAAADANVTIATKIFAADAMGQKTGSAVKAAAPVSVKIAAGQSAQGEQTLQVSDPKLWSIEKPNLYVAVTTIEQDGKAVDNVETVFGIRKLTFDANKGFLLNGVRVPLNGVCDHHDLGALGSAVNYRATERQVQILKSMGCNAIRTSHNPPSPELLDVCDRLGVVVMDESFDCWERGKTRNDYGGGGLWADWWDKDIRMLARRDRNHPCVIMWSDGNEIPDANSPRGNVIAHNLRELIHQEDPTRPVTAANNNAQGGFSGYQKNFDVFGFNYQPNGTYIRFHTSNPDMPEFGSETASCISSRGEYLFPVTNPKGGGSLRDIGQMSSYDLYAPPWAWPPDVEFKGLDQAPYTMGEFVWTGFDYIGEPTGGNNTSRSSYFGIIDLAGFPKDRFYIYQARWRPELPMAHILPHWNWPDRVGQVTPVHVYTSGDSAELFLNGKSLGKKTKEPLTYRLRWDDVVYQPGELKVVAYKNGKEWATDTMKTTGAASKLTMKADRATIDADGKDLSFVTVSVADKDGQMVPRSKNSIKFEISGPGEIVATDNGDATDLVAFPSKERKAFNGLALVIVRAKAGAAGEMKLTAQAEGLEPATITIRGAAK